MKRYYNTLKEAKEAIAQKPHYGNKAYKVKQGRHKGQYFVGTELEWFSL